MEGAQMRNVITLAAVIASAVALPAVAPAKNDPGLVQRTGKCSNGATWKLKAKPDDARLEVEFEVDQNVSGRRWSVVITRDGRQVFRGARITRPPSGSFSVNRRPADPAGPDRIVAIARAARGGVCRAALTV
jgi:hypothetical protein